MGNRLDINTMLTIDDNGMPAAPSLTQLLDKDIQELYRRDKSKDKHKYLQDAIVIYYLNVLKWLLSKQVYQKNTFLMN